MTGRGPILFLSLFLYTSPFSLYGYNGTAGGADGGDGSGTTNGVQNGAGCLMPLLRSTGTHRTWFERDCVRAGRRCTPSQNAKIGP